MSARQQRVVAYYYDDELGNYCYGGGNPMRPHRARMVYSLVDGYGLTKQMMIHRPVARSFDQLTEFHADDYIEFLKTVTPNNVEEYQNQLRRFNMGVIGDVDCPVFDGIYEYCSIYAGGSVGAAALLNEGNVNLAFNWSGGMHHAKKAEASGFCYVNDIVLGILELLKVHARVLYVDIDIHHGDGVEEAFYLTDRVMTVSFHKYGEFFPGTGALDDVGFARGKHYTVNVPMKDGMDDESYKHMFEPVMAKVMEMYQPGAIVMCCGADSLSGDKLGCFNLSIEGHSNCLEFLSKYNVPMLVLGGGGYTMRNVARCWTYETGRLMGVDLADTLPESALHRYNYYQDTQSLRIATSNMKNQNTREELEAIKRKILERLSQLPAVPSAQLTERPPSHVAPDLPEEDMEARGGGEERDDLRIQKDDMSDGEEEEQTGHARRDVSYREASAAPSAGAAAPEAGANGEQPSVVVTDGDGPAAMDTDGPASAAAGDAAGTSQLSPPTIITSTSPAPASHPLPTITSAGGGSVYTAAGAGGGAAPAPAGGITVLGPSSGVLPAQPATAAPPAASAPSMVGPTYTGSGEGQAAAAAAAPGQQAQAQPGSDVAGIYRAP